MPAAEDEGAAEPAAPASAAAADAPTPVNPTEQGGPDPNRPYCPLNKKIENPAPGTAEGTVAELYRAALGPDDDASFDRFYATFFSHHKRDWVRQQYWPRARQWVRTYVTQEDPMTFFVCREERSDDSVKMFIRSNDPKKSDPPITVKRDGGRWLVDFYTP
jgi:hypothetical protein